MQSTTGIRRIAKIKVDCAVNKDGMLMWWLALLPEGEDWSLGWDFPVRYVFSLCVGFLQVLLLLLTVQNVFWSVRKNWRTWSMWDWSYKLLTDMVVSMLFVSVWPWYGLEAGNEMDGSETFIKHLLRNVIFFFLHQKHSIKWGTSLSPPLLSLPASYL